jgi:hypothetical protein
MDCPNCGHWLTRLAEELAQTEVGTNCPSCWARIRRVSPPPAKVTVLKALKKPRRAAPLRRAA